MSVGDQVAGGADEGGAVAVVGQAGDQGVAVGLRLVIRHRDAGDGAGRQVLDEGVAEAVAVAGDQVGRGALEADEGAVAGDVDILRRAVGLARRRTRSRPGW